MQVKYDKVFCLRTKIPNYLAYRKISIKFITRNSIIYKKNIDFFPTDIFTY